MADINDLNVTDASNTARFPEGMARASVNNAARSLEGILARWHKDNNGSLVTAGTSTAITITLNQSSIAAWYDGLTFYSRITTTCGATPTINPTGSGALGAKSLYWPDGTQLAAGEIVAGGVYGFYYELTSDKVYVIGSKPSTVGPASATDNALVRFDGTTGKLVQNGVTTITDAGDLTIAGTGATTTTIQGTGGIVTNIIQRTDTHGDATQISRWIVRGKDSAGNVTNFGFMDGYCLLDNDGAEQGEFHWYLNLNGTETLRLRLGAGLYTASATGGDQGADKINSKGFYQDGAGVGWVALSRVTSAAAASYTWTTAAWFTAFRTLKLVGWLQPATDDVTLQLNISDDGGATYEADAADYQYIYIGIDSGGTNRTATSASATFIQIGPNDAGLAVGNASNERIQFEITLNDPASAAFGKLFDFKTSHLSAASNLVNAQGSGLSTAIAAVNGLRLQFESGNIAVGDVTLYGVVNA